VQSKFSLLDFEIVIFLCCVLYLLCNEVYVLGFVLCCKMYGTWILTIVLGSKFLCKWVIFEIQESRSSLLMQETRFCFGFALSFV
jgi:hypothetical protein